MLSSLKQHLLFHTITKDQESESSLARWFSIRVFHEVAAKLLLSAESFGGTGGFASNKAYFTWLLERCLREFPIGCIRKTQLSHFGLFVELITTWQLAFLRAMWSLKETEKKAMMLFDVASEVTYHHLCLISVVQTDLDKMWKKTTHGHKYQEAGIFGGHL